MGIARRQEIPAGTRRLICAPAGRLVRQVAVPGIIRQDRHPIVRIDRIGILSYGLVGDGVDFTAGAGDHYGQDPEPDRRAEKPYGSVGEGEIRATRM